MKYLLLCACIVLGFVSLSASAPSTEGVKDKIARKIWQNECAGSVKGLVSWNKGENFPSLGIGHFIWYLRGVRGPFEESFPEFVRFAASKGVAVPSWARGAAPWADRQAFLASDKKGGLADVMRAWLASHTEIQADFIIKRSVSALQRICREAKNPEDISRKYYAVASTPQGMYALIDYVNFKGEGVNAAERYRNQGWGLLQVLEEMRPVVAGNAASTEFSRAAGKVLSRRVANSPADRGERRWLQGWLNRCATYAVPL